MFKSLETKHVPWLSEQKGWGKRPGISFQVQKLQEKTMPGQAMLSRRSKGLSPALPGAE